MDGSVAMITSNSRVQACASIFVVGAKHPWHTATCLDLTSSLHLVQAKKIDIITVMYQNRRPAETWKITSQLSARAPPPALWESLPHTASWCSCETHGDTAHPTIRLTKTMVSLMDMIDEMWEDMDDRFEERIGDAAHMLSHCA